MDKIQENALTDEEKDIVIKDVCSRLPYWPYVQLSEGPDTSEGDVGYIIEIDTYNGDPVFSGYVPQDKEGYSFDSKVDGFKLLLRPIGSMTEEERKEFWNLGGTMTYDPEHDRWNVVSLSPEALDFVNKNRFDYRGLIYRGLATEITEEHDVD